MKRSKRLIILVSILAVISIVTVILSQYEQKQEQIKATDQVLLQIPFSSVQSFSWEYTDGDSMTFLQDETGWHYADDEAFPVSESKLMDVIGHFANFTVSFTIEAVDDYGQYGLDDPDCTITIQTEESTCTMKLGDYSQMDQQRYIDIGDGNVYLASEDPGTWVDYALSDLILHDDTPGFEDVVDVTFAGSESYSFVYKEDTTASYSAEDVYFVEEGGKSLPLDTSSVQQLLNTVTALELLDYVTYNATDEELASYGLQTPELSITVRYTEEYGEDAQVESCVIHIGSNAAEATDPDAATVTRYVRIGDSGIIYKLDSVDYGILTACSYNDLRHKELLWADFADVTQMDVTLEGSTHILTLDSEKSEEAEDDYDWYLSDTNVDVAAVQSALTALTVSEFTDTEITGQLELGLTLHLDSEHFPTAELRLYRHNGDLCLAQVDGVTLGYVSRSAAMDLVEAVQGIVLQ